MYYKNLFAYVLLLASVLNYSCSDQEEIDSSINLQGVPVLSVDETVTLMQESFAEARTRTDLAIIENDIVYLDISPILDKNELLSSMKGNIDLYTRNFSFENAREESLSETINELNELGFSNEFIASIEDLNDVINNIEHYSYDELISAIKSLQNDLIDKSLSEVEIQSLATIMVFAEDVISENYEHRDELKNVSTNGRTNSYCDDVSWKSVVTAAIGTGITSGVGYGITGIKAGATAGLAAGNPVVGGILGGIAGFTIGFVGGAIVGGIASYTAQKVSGKLFCDEEEKEIQGFIPSDCKTIDCSQNDAAMQSLMCRINPSSCSSTVTFYNLPSQFR